MRVSCLSMLLLCFFSHSHAAEPERYKLGRPATAAEIEAWDIDIAPDGSGLPPGVGKVKWGERVYRAQCASCHGKDGKGGAYGALVGRLPKDSFPFARDPTIKKTIGNYWPFATTVFDYVRRAMPYNAPGSLSDNEVYSVVAYLLFANGIIPESMQLGPQNLADIVMPSRHRFVPDDRRGGPEIR